MRKVQALSVAAALAITGLAFDTSAHAQAPAQPEPAITQPKVNLTLEQRFVIKELIKDLDVAPAPANSDTTIGATVPSSIKLNSMPADIASKVPQIKSHLFFLAGGKVVIVDPKENKIVDAFN